ncbi:MAG: hypothetical protein WA005_17500 [Candidatus Binataceae bacterium]
MEIENALQPASKAPRCVMTTYEDDIPKSARRAIWAKLEEIRTEIEDAKNYYDLYVDTISNRRRLSTKLSILGINLTECRPQYMRGFGEVPDQEREPLDERMSRLEAMITGLNRLLTSGK